MTRRSLFLGLAAMVVASACSRTDSPVDPVWGKEACAHCAMIVGDRRYAAQLLADGDRRFFDDIGCMVLWAEEHRMNAARAWVRDAEGGGWRDAKSATYSPGARTPMDFGFEARRDGSVGWSEMHDRVIAKRADGGVR